MRRFKKRDAFATALEPERLAVRFDPATALYRKKLGYLLLQKDPAGAIAMLKKAISG